MKGDRLSLVCEAPSRVMGTAVGIVGYMLALFISIVWHLTRDGWRNGR